MGSHTHNHSEPHEHHGHDHHELPKTRGNAFLIGIVLNLVFVVVEFGYGLASGSMALLADAGHNLSDVLGLALAWIALRLAQRQPTATFTYGLKRSTVLAALANSILLLVAVGGIIWEAAGRIRSPEIVQGNTMMLVAGIGLLINAGTAMLFLKGRKEDINVRAAFLHMAADAFVSLGVVVTGAVVVWTHWNWLDSAVSLAISAVIVWGTWSLLKDSLKLSMDAVPSSVNLNEVTEHLEKLPGVVGVHHLHIWALGAQEIALTAHLIIPSGRVEKSFFETVHSELRHRFGIAHATLQIEDSASSHCATCVHPALKTTAVI